MIACGRLHSLLIDPEGVVWVSGSNRQGQLGIGNLQDQHTFCKIQGVPSAVQVSAAVHGFHSAILDHQGDVYMFGANDESQTGSDEEQTRITSPIKVLNLPQIIMVSCGHEHSIALDIKGRLWGSGNNRHGQLSSEGVRLKKFTQITTDPIGIVVKISCGNQHSICQSETGELWGTGCNCFGELGVGHNRNVSRFQKVPFEGEILVQNFCCGIHLFVVLDNDGEVWATGYGAYGQLGSGNNEHKNKLTKMLNTPPMVYIASGGYGIIMSDRNGKFYVCGYNQQGQLGVGENKDILIPQNVTDLPRIAQGSIASQFSLVADEDGSVWASGYNYFGQHGNNECYQAVNKFVHIKGNLANTMNAKRFYNTKRAHQSE